MMKKLLVIFLTSLFILGLVGCDNTELPTNTEIEHSSTQDLTQDSDLENQLRYIYQLALEAQAFEGTYEEWLESVRGPQGEPGRQVRLQVNGGFIQWQYDGDQIWHNLISLDQLSGSSLYEIYKEDHPSYQASESQWLDDLINGRLVDNERHLVVFHSNGGTPIDSIFIDDGDSIDLPIPEREGYAFLGWFTGDSVNDDQFTVLSTVNRDLNLYAKWKADEHTILEDDMYQYFVTGNFAGWAESFGDSYYQFRPTSISDPELSNIKDKIQDASLLYTVEVIIPNESSGWDLTYHIGAGEVIFDGNLTLKFSKTTSINGEEIPLWWAPSPESGQVYNLTPNTLFIPNYVDSTSDEYIDGKGDWNANPVLYQPGQYTIVFAEINGKLFLGAILIEEDTSFPNEPTYVTGLYNYRYQTSDVRHIFMAAAEKYLIETMAAGVPMYVNQNHRVFSTRLVLPIENYMPIMGFGEKFGHMTEDDSSVLMADGQPGNIGEYTYRTLAASNPETWNQWLYNTNSDGDYMALYYDAPYTYQFNDDKTGFELAPSMMAKDPLPVNPYVNEYGVQMTNTWRFEVKDNLEWFYHPDTDISNITDNKIDANDFVETYKLVLKEKWFRAVSGGGDFVSSQSPIVGAEAYSENPTEENWAKVGIRLIDDHTFEFTFTYDLSEWNVKAFMSSFAMSPIHTQLYQQLGDPSNGGTYGTSHTSIAYSGPFYVSEYEVNHRVMYKENPHYHDPDAYFYTGYEIQIIIDSDLHFQQFEAGTLEAVDLPPNRYNDYQNHPGLKQIPQATTYRLMINGIGNTQNQEEQFPESTYEPEPLLANQDFNRAMYFVMDRNTIANDIIQTAQPQMYLFSDAYLVEVEKGIPYRQTQAGLMVGQGLFPETNAHKISLARAYWQQALESMVDEGIYDYEDVIELDLYIMSGTEKQTLLGQYIKETFEGVFNADSNDYGIQVIVNVQAKDFPDIYLEHMMKAEFDLAIGGISASVINPTGFLDIYSDDNRSGFLMNWGFDTSTANIEVKYLTHNYNQYGDVIKTNYHYEIWSYNAIASVLNGEIFIQDGKEANKAKPVFQQILPTEFTFKVEEFHNTAYTNITYSIYQYLSDGSGYQIFNDLKDETVSQEVITINGTKPYPYNYEIVINYDLVYGDNERQYSTHIWSPSSDLIEAIITSDQSAKIRLYTDDFNRYFVADSVVVYLASDSSQVTDAQVIYDGSSIEITGLSPDTDYYIDFQTSDGFTDEWIIDLGLSIDFSTDPTPIQ